MSEKHATVALLASIGIVPAVATADIVRPDADALAIYSRNTLSFGVGVSVQGSVASVGLASTGNGASIAGNVYTGEASFGDNNTLGGDVYTSGQTWIGSGSSVSGDVHAGGNLTVGGGGTFGSMFAAGTFGVSSGSFFDGVLHGSHAVWVDRGVTVTGGVAGGPGSWVSPDAAASPIAGSPIAPTLWQSPAAPARPAVSTGGAGLWTGSVLNVNPGSHGSLWANDNSTLSFSAGEHGFSGFGAGSNVTLTFDTTGGDIVLYSSSGFSINSGATFDVIGDGRVSIHADGDIWFGTDAELAADFYSHSGMFSMEAGSSLEGAIYAFNGVWIGDGSTVVAPDVPAPATAPILAIAAAAFSGRRRR